MANEAEHELKSQNSLLQNRRRQGSSESTGDLGRKLAAAPRGIRVTPSQNAIFPNSVLDESVAVFHSPAPSSSDESSPLLLFFFLTGWAGTSSCLLKTKLLLRRSSPFQAFSPTVPHVLACL